MRCLRAAILALMALLLQPSAQMACQVQEQAQAPPRMILVEGGTFIMGEESGRYNTSHKVTVSSFYMASYEVTLGLWKRFTREALPEFSWNDIEFISEGHIGDLQENDQRPAYYMNWYEAVRFCNWLSKKQGLKPAYVLTKYQNISVDSTTLQWKRPKVQWDQEANGYRLPTEAEWEYAARGGRRSGGYLYAGSNVIDEVAWSWTSDRSSRWVRPVGQKKPNELGLYDMSGNVSEFCWDYYSTDYYRVSPTLNPTGPDRGYVPDEVLQADDFVADDIPDSRSIRGGSCHDKADWGLQRTSARGFFYDHRRYLVGIRLVRNAPEP